MTSNYPETARTWIEQRLDDGPEGQREVQRYLMELYARPLGAYVASTRYRRLAEPQELVEGFFADRLARPTFLHDWQRGGRRLRHWLRTGLEFYMKEQLRERSRDRRRVALPTEPETADDPPERILDRAFAVSLVRAALEDARVECERRGLSEHFELFRAHHWHETPYAHLASSAGLGAARARVMARTAREAFRRALRGLIARERGSRSEVDSEIDALLEALG